MAFTQSFPSAKHPGEVHSSYNVDWGVGRSGSNGREDTMLVQAMFRMYYWEITDFDYDLDPPPGETEQIEVDGWYGPITQKYIDYFQQKMFANDPGATLVDGVMDPYRESPWSESKVSRTRYALGKLVARCRNFCEWNGEDYFVRLPYREDVPVQLRNALKIHKAKAAKYRYG